MTDRDGRHVLIVVQNLPVPLDRRVWLECNALTAAGYRVSVICPKGPGDPKFHVVDGVRIHKYKPPPQASGAAGFFYEFLYCWLITAWLSWKVWRRDRFDALQACNPPDTYWALALLWKARGVRFVYDQHDLCPEVYTSRFERPSRTLLRGLRLLERATYASADHVINTNRFEREVTLAHGRHRADQATVVRNGPVSGQMQRVDPDPSVRNGRGHLCCYLGIMGPQDGVDLVVRVAEVVVRELGRNDVQFALLGFGDCLAELQELTTSLGLDDHVTFTGRADDVMIRRYLSSSDVGLAPDPKTPFNDISTMNKTIEYMSYELPVVSFDLRENRASAGDAAIYVEGTTAHDFAKVLVELLDDPDRRAEMGRIGRERVVRELAWEHQAATYVGVYDNLLDAR